MLTESQMLAASLPPPLALKQSGRVVQALGMLIKAGGITASLGELCYLYNSTRVDAQPVAKAEVVGFQGNIATLSVLGGLQNIQLGMSVVATGQTHHVLVSNALLGRVVDALGQNYLDQDCEPISDKYSAKNQSNTGESGNGEFEDGDFEDGDFEDDESENANEQEAPVSMPVESLAPSAMDRPRILDAMWTGIRAIDGFLTVGVGQRLGVFAPAGCGKTTLLTMLCANSNTDVIIVALVGERGREVADFLEHAIPENKRNSTIVVVATSDRSAGERLKAAFVATTYAEYFRDQGKSVLLLVDSVTRFARAAREIGLSAGELPARKGFPPSVFALLPKLLERAGNTHSGSITAFYTVLEDGEDESDPISEEVRSLIDGHIVLSRKLANAGHFPAIDVLASLSRLMSTVATSEHADYANKIRSLLSKHKEVELLIRLGEYKPGNDQATDEAVAKADSINEFLKQRLDEYVSNDTVLENLCGIVMT